MDDRLEMITQFEKYVQRRSPERRTAKDYVSDLRQFAATCPKAWREVNLHDIDDFVDQQRQAGLSSATVRRRVATLKTFFDFLAEESGDLSWPNPVRFKRHGGKPAKRLPRDLSNDQVARLWVQIDSVRDRAWFALMLRAGLRVGEVVSLTETDLLRPPGVDQPARLRVRGKGQKERIVLLTADAYAVVQEWLRERPEQEAETLFLNQRGQPLSPSGIEWLLKQYGQAMGLPVTPHQLRHTFARQLTEGGMPLTSLSKLLGHSQVSTTQIYTAGADPELSQAYQTAMAHLDRQAPASVEVSPPQAALPARLVPATEEPAPELPTWSGWAAELPAGLRQASLALVKRRWPTWKPQRRRAWAVILLASLRRFWQQQLARRPLTDPTELRLSDLQAFQSEQLAAGKASRTIERQLDDILTLLRQLADQGEAVDPALFRLRRLPRPQTLPRHLSETQSQHLERFVQSRLETSDPLLRLENACFFVLAHTGMRANECVDLCGQDLDLPRRRVWVRQGKGQRDRVVYLSETATQALSTYLADHPSAPSAPLFVRPTGQPINYKWLKHHIKQLGQAAGAISVTPHQLRHTLATRLLNAGMKITYIQKILGHEHLDTTMIYARVLDKTMEADYQHVMHQLEQQQLPLSRTPTLVADWPVPPTPAPKVQAALLAISLKTQNGI
jgi:site-specific recombinase XerD